MARIRSIKPAFWASEALATRLRGPDGRQARLLFIGLWGLAEDLTGVLRGHPSRIRSDLFAYDDDVSAADIERWLGLLEAGRFIVRYERDGSRYVWVRGFLEHQKIDKPSKPTLPEPSDTERAGRSEPSTSPPRALHEPSAPEVGSRKGGGEDEEEDLPPSADASAGAEQEGFPDFVWADDPPQEKPPRSARKPREKRTEAPPADPKPFTAACDMLTRVYADVRKADYGFGLNATRNGKAVRELLWGDGAKGQERGDPLVSLEELERRWRIGLAWKGFPACNAIWDLREHWAAYAQPQGAQRTRQQEIWEGLQTRRKEALEATGRTYTPEMATADYINTTLARWKDTRKGEDTEELTALGAAFIHFCEDPRFLEKGLPVKLFLSPGVFAECEAKDNANLFYIADLRAPGIR